MSPIFCKKQLWTAWLLLCSLAVLTGMPGTMSAAANLLANGSFEQGSEGWKQDVWEDGEEGKDASLLTVDETGGRTGKALVIESLVPNDAKWVQTVVVDPGATYRLSGWIKTDRTGMSAKGANLSVLGVLDTSPDLLDTGGKWEYIEMYGKTGSSQKEIQVALRLGGYGSLNEGKAHFDDIELEKVETVPSGQKVVPLAPTHDTGKTPAQPATPLPTLLFAAIFLMVFGLADRSWIRPAGRPDLLPDGARRAGWLPLVLVLAGAAVLRWLAAKAVFGYPGDMNTFAAWAQIITEHGFSGYYENAGFADYPPGYLYVLYGLGLLAKAMSWTADSELFALVLKTPAMLADLASAVLIYRLAAARLPQTAAAGLALIYAVNPAVVADSAAWGQVDSFFTLFLAVYLVLLDRGKLTGATAIYALAVLIKPQALIFAPVLLVAWASSRSWRTIGLSVLSGAAVFIAGVLPFALHHEPLWIVKLYKETLASYPYATLNAFNLFALTGGNGIPQTEKLLFLSYQAWGWLFIVWATAFTFYLYARRRKDRPVPYALLALVLIATVFILGVKMHERYLFPALLLAILAYVRSGDRRLLYLYAGFSMTAFFNIGYVLAGALRGTYMVDRLDPLLLGTSIANVALLFWLYRIAADLTIRGRVVTARPEKPVDDSQASARWLFPAPGGSAGQVADLLAARRYTREREEKRGRLTRRDGWLMGGLTAVYAAIALFQLGSFHEPQTAWKPAAQGERVIVDLGEAVPIERLNAFGGIGDGKLRVEFAERDGSWTDAKTIDLTYTRVFTWTSVQVQTTARYVRLQADAIGFEMKEIGLFAKDAEKPIAIRQVTVEGGADMTAASRLFDEQAAVPYKPTFLHGTYFDEIYHARAAYEHLEGIKPYENTHPPLGKELIAAGVYVFGMTPFGWRIVGTLFGIGMLPLMYVFAKRIFGRTEFAFIAAFLLAVDFMHFAQTRISTIDVYGVFFIMIMFFFMHRYTRMSFYDVPLRRTLAPLFWSGLLFGIGAASKWIVIYGGAGLALLFFLSLYERYREYAAAKAALAGAAGEPGFLQSDQDELNRIVRLFPRLAAKTVAWCSLFFVLLPIVLYSLSFVPIMMSEGEELSVKKLISYQTDMFDYHSKLVATHSFGSQWWEWPFMVRPIWYYTGQALLPEGQIASIISMGNPAIWWLGTLAVPVALLLLHRRWNRGILVAGVAFFSQYLPWMLVPRLTFIYHYFAMVPFLILCLTYVFQYAIERNAKLRKPVYVYLGICFVLFAMFYPVLSGMTVSRQYAAYFLKWFQSWYFYS